MKKIVFFVLLLSTCGCCRQAIPVRSEKSDSVRIEHSTQYIERVRFDTVLVEVPAQSAAYTGPADSSRLETDFATSHARINPDGTLSHDLQNKPQRHPVIVPVLDTEKTIARDSIVSSNQQIELPVKLPLTQWQKFCIWSGVAAWGTLLIFIVCKIIKR